MWTQTKKHAYSLHKSRTKPGVYDCCHNGTPSWPLAGRTLIWEYMHVHFDRKMDMGSRSLGSALHYLLGRPTCRPVEEYLKHRSDTHEVMSTDDSIEKCMDPWLIADVRYDAFTRRWFLVLPEENPISLHISDPSARDAEVINELEDLPRVWKARIWRGGSFEITADIQQPGRSLL